MIRLDHALQWIQAQFFFVKQKCKELLALKSPEMRFLVDRTAAASATRSLKNAKVEHLWDTAFLQSDATVLLDVLCSYYSRVAFISVESQQTISDSWIR